jgi:hypothetical protein
VSDAHFVSDWFAADDVGFGASGEGALRAFSAIFCSALCVAEFSVGTAVDAMFHAVVDLLGGDFSAENVLL